MAGLYYLCQGRWTGNGSPRESARKVRPLASVSSAANKLGANPMNTKQTQIEAARRREAERERRLFVAANQGREQYQVVCEQVDAERRAEREVQS